MAKTNRERVEQGLDLLKKGLRPFIEREMRAVLGARWVDAALSDLKDSNKSSDISKWDSQALLSTLIGFWQQVFSKQLGSAERSLVGELKDTRNKWAHQQPFNTDDAYRALDSIHRLLSAISAPEAAEANKQKQEILRIRFDEQAQKDLQKATAVAIKGEPASGLKSWRSIVTPHPDVASGRYQQAEFMADLAQVRRGEGTDEYKNPTEFFRRTFITEGLKRLLVIALRRLSGKDTDPVVELQTNFGGGKTHSMLALYHIFSGTEAGELPGIEPVMETAGVKKLPKASRVVLVGTALSPAQPRKEAGSPTIQTLWGELAWHLLGKKGYDKVAESDKKGISPGSDILRDILKEAAPCLILVDELVTYIRQTYQKHDLAGGSFDANLSFVQALTEAVRAVPQVLLVVSVPSSQIEIGGEGGQVGLEHLKQVLGRVESPWRPATAEEGFEIVRRRLFQPITDPSLATARDAVVKAFMNLYRGDEKKEFPPECGEADYERRLKNAYPVHPELFDRLYNDWGALDKFQHTRGVLRLLAAVIYTLWERQDQSLLILPGMVPIDDPVVQSELTRYLDNPWVPILENEVDSPKALPLRIDRDNPNLGRYSACRRVARTIYLGSAPTSNLLEKEGKKTALHGIEEARIKLGCVQTGESTATFTDALRRLIDQATHLFIEDKRCWFSTQPTVTKMAQERAAQLELDKIYEAIRKRLKSEQDKRGELARVHVCPSSADVPDEISTALVILPPDVQHVSKAEESPAKTEAGKFLQFRGTSPRYYQNMLVFLAPDRNKFPDLEQAVRQYLAWESILLESEKLNLDPFRKKQAEGKFEHAKELFEQQLPEVYRWLLVPSQPKHDAPFAWEELKLTDQGTLAERVSKKLLGNELLLSDQGRVRMSGTRLRHELDTVPQIWEKDHVAIKQLLEYFGKYLYLPRIRDPQVLFSAIMDGLRLLTWESESFAYADGWDETRKRYVGLRAGQSAFNVTPQESGLLVKPEAALKQFEKEAVKVAIPAGTGNGQETSSKPGKSTESPTATQVERKLRRFHGSVSLDPSRVGRDAGRIAEEVLQHITGLMGAQTEVTLEIQAEIPDGAPDSVTRTVTENCRTLKFRDFGFEEE